MEINTGVSIDNVPSLTLIFGRLIKLLFLTRDIVQFLNKRGETNHIERLNNTLRQRISRLVRKSLSFSKDLDNHIGAIWYFIHHYNDVIANS